MLHRWKMMIKTSMMAQFETVQKYPQTRANLPHFGILVALLESITKVVSKTFCSAFVWFPHCTALCVYALSTALSANASLDAKSAPISIRSFFTFAHCLQRNIFSLAIGVRNTLSYTIVKLVWLIECVFVELKSWCFRPLPRWQGERQHLMCPLGFIYGLPKTSIYRRRSQDIL